MDTPVKEASSTASLFSSPGKAAKAKAKVKPTTLLDVHEVEWITRELERLLARESVGAGAVHDGHHQHQHHRHHHRRRTAKLASPAQDQRPHAKKGGGFLTELIGKHAASICGEDTVTRTAAPMVSGRRRPRRGRVGFREVDKL